MGYHFAVQPKGALHREEKLSSLGTEAQTSQGQGAMHANIQEKGVKQGYSRKANKAIMK